MENKINQILEVVGQLAKNVAQLTDGQAQIIKRLDSLEVGQEGLKQSFTDMQTELSEIGKTVNSSQGDIIALLERIATKESVQNLEAGVKVLNERLFNQEIKIQTLSLVK